MAEIVLETERLILRTQAPGDQEQFLLHLNSPLVRQYLRGPQKPHEIEAGFAKVAAMRAQHGFGFMVVQHKATGDVIGNCGLKLIDGRIPSMEGSMEVGWLLRADYWRQGYAFEAANACIDWAFSRFDAPHVLALTCERNIASWKMMEKLGMARRADLDFIDPDWPPEDNPTIIYWIEKPQ
jgi:RimJ/RimL family protein N-acetyltransferase